MKDRLGSLMGGLVAVVFIGGSLFYQCVWPFLRDTSDTFTCADEEIRSMCADPHTLGGFFASVCGQDEVTFTTNIIQNLTLGEPGDREPDDGEFIVTCGESKYTWYFEGGQVPDDFDGVKGSAADKRTKNAVDVYGDYQLGLIDIDDARVRLFEE